MNKIQLTKENIDDLMVCALEGGINYWCDYVEVIQCPEKYGYASDVISMGGSLMVHVSFPNEKHELTLEKFMKGVEYACNLFNFNDAEELMDNHDAETADVIVQYALFGEIVFC